MERNVYIIILDKPFLKTTQTKIYVCVTAYTMEFSDYLVQFNILNTLNKLLKTICFSDWYIFWIYW